MMGLFSRKNKGGADKSSRAGQGSGDDTDEQHQRQQPQQDGPQQRSTDAPSRQGLTLRPAKTYNTQDVVQESIGRFCGLQEDWSIVLDLSDRLKTSTAASKIAAEALRQEFKHGQPTAQERAAKLLVILTRNTSDRFKLQIAEPKFLKTLKATVESQKTDPKVKAMLFKAIGVIVYENQGDRDLQPLMTLYVDIKPSNAPLDGIPLEDGDKTFDPEASFMQAFNTGGSRSRRRHHGSSNGNGFSPQVQMEQLKHRVTVAKSEANMLSETLAFTPPAEIHENQIVQEFYRKVLAWQEFVSEQLPWVQAEAGKAADQQPTSGGDGLDYEKILDLLLSANTEIHEALTLYHDIEQRNRRQKQEESELQMVTERSKLEKTRMNGHESYDAGIPSHDAAAADGSAQHLGYGLAGGSEMAPVASSSGSSRSEASGSGGDAARSSLAGNKSPILQTNNPYLSRSEPTNTVMPDRYVVDEPDEVHELASGIQASGLGGPSQSMPASGSGLNIGSRNPFGAYMTGSPQRAQREDSEASVALTPTEPSAKALGKLRRVSGMEGEAEQQQRTLEEQLRQKYQQKKGNDQPESLI